MALLAQIIATDIPGFVYTVVVQYRRGNKKVPHRKKEMITLGGTLRIWTEKSCAAASATLDPTLHRLRAQGCSRAVS